MGKKLIRLNIAEPQHSLRIAGHNCCYIAVPLITDRLRGRKTLKRDSERKWFHDNVGSHARVNFGGADQPRLGRKEPNMMIIGCDYHPSFEQIAFVDTDTGEFQEQRLAHREEAKSFIAILRP